MIRNWMRPVGLTLTSLLVGGMLTGCGVVKAPGQTYAPSSTVELVKRGPGGVTRFLGRNVMYRLDPTITMHLIDMNADIILKDPTMPFVPANKTDYQIQIHHAKVEKEAAGLEELMNNYVFNEPDSPLKEIKIRFKGDRIVMGGKMKKFGIWNAFEMEGTVEPTPDGMIRMTPKAIKAAGVPVQGLMNLVGLEMSKLLKTKEEKGVIMNGNEIIMDPARLYPPPTLNGRIVAVSVRNNRLNIEFDSGKARPWPELPVPQVKSCMVMWGGDVLINAVLNLNAKMQIIDSTPATPMLFAIDRYREQLEAGMVIPTKAGHLIAYVPDVTSFAADMGRYAPPSFPIPGVHSPQQSDMPPTDSGGSEGQPQQPMARGR